MTKIHEEFKRGSLSELLDYYKQKHPRGEITLVLEGSKEERADEAREQWTELSLEEHVQQIEEQGVSLKEAIKEVAKLRGVPKRDVYSHIHSKG
ncbi:hypothetical protein N752_15455 [Desulforamulus aquiferis]|nr:hypothetical protein N752_15455 [Desulforamulus aquiferis]